MSPPTRWYLWGAPLAIILAVFVCYYQVRDFSFVGWDDNDYVTSLEPDTPGNPHVMAGLTPESVKWAITSGEHANWFPLTWLSLMLDVQMFGVEPGPIHITSAVLHLLNSLLLYRLLGRMTGAWGCSLVVALLFAVHPLHVESVAWVSERKDVLSTLFWMLTGLAYVRYVERETWGRYLLMLLCFVLGLMSKPMVITLPCVLLLWDYWPLGRWSAMEFRQGKWPAAARLVREKTPMFLLIVASAVVTIWAQHKGEAIQNLQSLPLDIRIANVAQSYLAYVGQMVWPTGMACFYPYPVHLGSPANLRVQFALWGLASIVAIVGITVVCLVFRRSRPYLPVGWFWYLGTLLPVIGLVQVGNQARADRYTYIPLIGIFVALTWLVADWVGERRLARRAATVAATLIVLICTAITWHQVQYWRNTDAMCQHTLAVTENNDSFEKQYGVILSKRQLYAQAEPHLQAALALRPDIGQYHYDYGTMLRMAIQQGQFPWTWERWNEAREHLETALRTAPKKSLTLYELGNLYDDIERFRDPRNPKQIDPQYADKAMQYYAAALKIDPENARSLFNLGVLISEYQLQPEQALPYFQKAVESDPLNTKFRMDLARMLERLNRRKEAAEQLEILLNIAPQYPGAREMLQRIQGL